MNINHIYDALAMASPYTGRAQKTHTDVLSFALQMQKIREMSTVKTAACSDYIGYVSQAYSTGKLNAANFEDAFPQYDVVTHVGNTDVSSANWQRNDFPFWKYFNKNTSADSLNDWKPSGPNPPQTDAGIQRNLSSIGAGKMAVLIPESLQKKMDADENYARQVMAKVQKWKEEYDLKDNALAASYGYDVFEHQFSKSYCIQLDENGEVVNATVTSGGRITKSSDEMVKAYYKRKKKREEYKRIDEKKALNEELWENVAEKRYYQREITAEAALAAYQSGFITGIYKRGASKK